MASSVLNADHFCIGIDSTIMGNITYLVLLSSSTLIFRLDSLCNDVFDVEEPLTG